MWIAPATSPRASRWNEDLMNNVRRVAIAAAVGLLAAAAVTAGEAPGSDAAGSVGLPATRAALEDRPRRVGGEVRAGARGRDGRAGAAQGGAAPYADVSRPRINRSAAAIRGGGALQRAIADGRTVDEAGLVAGDQFIVPRRAGTSAGEVLRFGGFLLSIPVTIYTLTRIF